MPNSRVALAVSVCLLVACGGEAPAPVAPPPVTSAPVPPAPAPVATEASPPAEPSPEEQKKAADLRALEQDRAKWKGENEAELARWTPELHASAAALAKKYATGRAAIQAAVAGKHRKPGNADRDKARHPVETLSFFGFKPTLTVLEVDPGEGWYTELLAPALIAQGKLMATTGDPAGPEDARSTFGGQRYKAFLEKAPEIYGKVQTVVVDDKAPALGLDGSVDMVLLARAAHGMVNNGTLSAWLKEIAKSLKHGGVLGIEQHRAPAGADPIESAKKGYLPEKWLIEQCEAAGLKLAGKSEVNANPKDTKDYSEGVWALPPTLRLGDKDRSKYVAIGESDRMTLKFVKP